MKDELNDIVSHTHGLGIIDLVKVVGDDKETNIVGVANDKSVVLNAKFHAAKKEFEGVFGMPNLAKLSVLLNIPEYAEDATIELTTQERNGDEVPTGIHFENSNGDFNNDYRFMVTEVINEKIKKAKFKGVNWHVDFEPSDAAIQRLKYQAQANSEETTFVAITDGSDLKFKFGDHSTHAGEFIFEPDIDGELKRAWNWPVAQVMSILNLPGDASMKFSDDGAAMITVKSDVATYEYIIPAQQK